MSRLVFVQLLIDRLSYLKQMHHCSSPKQLQYSPCETLGEKTREKIDYTSKRTCRGGRNFFFFYLFHHWLWVKYLTYRKSLKDFEGGPPSSWVNQRMGEYQFGFQVHMVNIHSFSESLAEKTEKKWKVKYVRPQAFWRHLSYLSKHLFKFRQPFFGVELDMLRESLQVKEYLRARGA